MAVCARARHVPMWLTALFFGRTLEDAFWPFPNMGCCRKFCRDNIKATGIMELRKFLAAISRNGGRLLYASLVWE